MREAAARLRAESPWQTLPTTHASSLAHHPLHPDTQAGSAGFPTWQRAPFDPPSTLCRTTIKQNQLPRPCLQGSRGPWDQVQTPRQTLEAAPELAPACLLRLLPGPLSLLPPCCPESKFFPTS